MATRALFMVSALSLAVLAAGCASTSGLSTQASLRDANALASQKSLAGTAVTPANWPRSDWWTSLGDRELDRLIDEALAGSPTLKVAAARTRKALSFAETSKAALYPRVDASYEGTRERFAEHGLVPPPAAGGWRTVHQLQATLNWELDFWGKNRAAFESALGEVRAAEVDAYAARLALSANIAQAYVQLQRAYLQLDVAQSTLKEREQIFALTRDRNVAGIDSRLELKQAESALPATREQIAQLDETIALTRNQLAALLGQGPDRGLSIGRPDAHSLGTVALPASLPAELLGRRPDLVAERARVEAAQKDIAVESYNQTLADALRDVVDNLASSRSVAEQRREQAQALSTAQEAYDLALLRYREGIGNYLQVLSAEQPLLAQQSLDADLKSRELSLSIDLVRALGGGFDDSASGGRPAPVAAIEQNRSGKDQNQ